jgi:hypothetical protein
MSTLADMAVITADHADEKLRFFAGIDPETQDIEVHELREDLEWTDRRGALVDEELHEVAARDSYEHSMDATNVNQIIKVADDKVLFTGFVGDDVAIAAFERGIFPLLPGIVAEFREYLESRDIDFISLEM